MSSVPGNDEKVKMKSILNCQLAPLQFNNAIIVNLPLRTCQLWFKACSILAPSINWQKDFLKKQNTFHGHCSPMWILSYCDCVNSVQKSWRFFLRSLICLLPDSIPLSLTVFYSNRFFFPTILHFKHQTQPPGNPGWGHRILAEPKEKRDDFELRNLLPWRDAIHSTDGIKLRICCKKQEKEENPATPVYC